MARPSERRLEALCERLGHRFARPELLRRALTHRSRANEDGEPDASNERLEFLGDAVLGLVVAELAMSSRPSASEGELTHARADAVNGKALAAHARALGLDDLVRLGRGEARQGGREKDSILANVFEAVVGALYLEAGLEAAREFLERELGAGLAGGGNSPRDAKTELQQRLHAAGLAAPVYTTLAESGPPHAREFSVAVSIGERVCGRGAGSSKQAAEQVAAREAILSLAGEVA